MQVYYPKSISFMYYNKSWDFVKSVLFVRAEDTVYDHKAVNRTNIAAMCRGWSHNITVQWVRLISTLAHSLVTPLTVSLLVIATPALRVLFPFYLMLFILWDTGNFYSTFLHMKYVRNEHICASKLGSVPKSVSLEFITVIFVSQSKNITFNCVSRREKCVLYVTCRIKCIISLEKWFLCKQ
jgi:hypothetical protein